MSEKIIVADRSDETIRKLYEEYHIRAREIGSVLNRTEDAILRRLKKMGVITLPRSSKRKDVILVSEIAPEAKDLLTEEFLLLKVKEKKTSADIARELGTNETIVRDRFRKFKITPHNPSLSKMDLIRNTPVELLKEDYQLLNRDQFSTKYGISVTLWKPYLVSLGIKLKGETQASKAKRDLTPEQKHMVIGSMLGDGGIKGGRFYESHGKKQFEYLGVKRKILAPFVSRTHEEKGCLRMTTVTLNIFKEYESLFYREGIKGKHIPVDLIKENWDPSILAYWFLDDGYYDAQSKEILISNKCPDESQLKVFVEFLSDKLGWSFRYRKNEKTGMFFVTLPVRDHSDFFDLVIKYASPCMYYKFPKEKVPSIKSSEYSITIETLTPGVYGSLDEKGKDEAESILFSHYRKKGFPYVSLTEEQLKADYKSLTKSVRGQPEKISNNTILLPRNVIGSRFLNNFFPNIYECSRKGSPSPVSSWDDDASLKKLIKNRLKYGERLTPASFRTGIKLKWGAVYNFRMETAAQVYKHYNTNGRVLDYSSGFGSRALTAYLLGLDYTGYEPNTKTYSNIKKMYEWVSKEKMEGRGSIEIRPQGSENMILEKGKYGLAFSSPPYFDLESYGSENTQSIVKYPHRSLWMEKYWKETISKSVENLTDDGYFIACLSPHSCEDIIEKTDEYCSSLGLYRLERVRVPLPTVYAHSDKHELLIVYSKSKIVCKESLPLFSNEKESSPVISRTFVPESSKKLEDALVKADKDKCLEESKSLGPLTREAWSSLYKEDKVTFASHKVEHLFGKWSQFQIESGFSLKRSYNKPQDNIKEYLEYCLSKKKFISFKAYGKAVDSDAKYQRLVRLFKKDKPLYDLKDKIPGVCLGIVPLSRFMAEVEEKLYSK